MKSSSAGGRRVWLRRVVGLLVLAIVLNGYAAAFVHRERALFRADQVRHWAYAASIARVAESDPMAVLNGVARSVASSELTALAAIPIAAVMLVAGDSRSVFIHSTLNIYGLLAVAVFGLVLSNLYRRRFGRGPAAEPWGAVVTLLVLATMWRPIFMGSVGVGGVAVGVLVLGLYLRDDVGDHPIRALLLIAFLLVLLFLFRRWYGFWVVSFAMVAVVDAACSVIRRRDWSRAGLWRSVKGPVIMSVGAGGLVLALAAPVVLRILGTDYGDRFIAYRVHDSVASQLRGVVDEFGVLVLGTLLAAAVVLIADRRARRPALMMTLQMVLTYVLFRRVQDHGAHHWYLYYPGAMLLIGLLLSRIFDLVHTRWRRAAVVVVAMAVAALVPARVLVGWPASSAAGWWLPRATNRPAVRHDLPEMARLLTYLDRLLARDPAYVYVVADSSALSDHTIAFANLSLQAAYRVPAFVLESAHVDRRDGFPRGLLRSGYVVVADPAQVHLRPEDQQVITIPARSFLDGRDIARAFTRLPEEFTLDDGVRVLVYRRTAAILPADLEELCARFRAAYPDRPEVFTP